MAAHKIWVASSMRPDAADYTEISEFQLYAGATRVDASATLTANQSPVTGTLAALSDGSAGVGRTWDGIPANLRLTWTFPAPVEVTHVVLGSRSVRARFPRALAMAGWDVGSDDVARPVEFFTLGGIPYVSNSLTARLPLGPVMDSTVLPVLAPRDYLRFYSHNGRIPFLVEKQVEPATVPPTTTPQWAKVRLERETDGAVVAEKWSDPVTGAGSFENIDASLLYTLTAIYPTTGMRAVIADRIQPEEYGP